MPRHYTANFNFRVTDSIPLQRERPLHSQQVQGDTMWVTQDDILVVAQISVIPEDSIDTVWVKVARDQMTQGWVRESRLLESVVPRDPISEYINLFSSRHTDYFMSFTLLILLLWLWFRSEHMSLPTVHFNDIKSGYPATFCLTLSAAAMLYAAIQKYYPDEWQEYYFHPSLNPFGWPLMVSLFLISVWLLIIMAIATVQEMFRLLSGRNFVLYAATLTSVAMVDYMLFTMLPFPWASIPLFVLYTLYALYQMYGKG